MDDSTAPTPPRLRSRPHGGLVRTLAKMPTRRLAVVADVVFERRHAVEPEGTFPRSLESLVDEAGFQAFGRELADYRDLACWPLIRPDLVRAAALLVAAIELIDLAAATGAAATSSTEVRA